MGDLDRKDAPSPIQVVGDDEQLCADVFDDNGVKRLQVSKSTSAVDAIFAGNVYKQAEVTIPDRNENDLAGVTYTVPSGKKFVLTGFYASYDWPAAMIVRLKKQTGGSGPFNTIMRMVVLMGATGDPTFSFELGPGVIVADATDVIKVTYEAAITKGVLWAGFSGGDIDA